MFVHLRGRSTYSMLEGIGSFSDIFQKVAELGQNSVAITDLNGLYGLVSFYTTAKNFKIKPLLGVEIPYVSSFSTYQKQKSDLYPVTITLLSRNKEGYHNLMRLVSQGYFQTKDGIPYIDREILQKFGNGLCVLLGGINSYMHQLIQSDSSSDFFVKEFLNDCVTACGKENCYIDITAQSYDDYPFLKKCNDALISLSQEMGYSSVVTSGFYYPEIFQKDAYQTALAIKDGKKTYDSDARKILGQNHHILSEQEIRDILFKNNFSDHLIELLIENTILLANNCVADISLGQVLFPNFTSDPDVKNLYEKYKKNLLEE